MNCEWQKDGKTIRRWDNAPHHKDLVNFPHHVHDGNDILSGEDVNLTDVLNFIEEKVKTERKKESGQKRQIEPPPGD